MANLVVNRNGGCLEMTHRERIEMLKSTIETLYVKEGRSKSYIARLLEVDRRVLTYVLNDEWQWEQGNVRYLKPSNKKFLNKHKNLIKSRLDNDISINDIAKELGVSRHYLGQTIIPADEVLTLAREHFHQRIKTNAEQELLEQKSKSQFNYDFDDLPSEVWKQVLGYDDYYVSNKGRVKRYVKTYDDYMLMTTHPNQNNGRVYVWLNKKGLILARLVGFAFVEGHSDERDTINHIDGDVTNNNADNLEWVSQSENNKHSYRELDRPTNKAGQTYGHFKKIILDDKYEFKTIVALAKFIGVSQTQVRRYIDGETKSDYTFKFIY